MGLLIGIIALGCLLGFMLTEVPRCDRCGTVWGVEHRRMNTMYHHEPSNWTDQCPACFKETEEYWEEMWDMYYSGLL